MIFKKLSQYTAMQNKKSISVFDRKMVTIFGDYVSPKYKYGSIFIASFAPDYDNKFFQ